MHVCMYDVCMHVGMEGCFCVLYKVVELPPCLPCVKSYLYRFVVPVSVFCLINTCSALKGCSDF